MEELRFVPVAHRILGGTMAVARRVEEGMELGEGGAAMAVVVAGFDVERVAGVGEIVFEDGRGVRHGGVGVGVVT